MTNPPYGVSWRTENEFIVEESKNPNGRFPVGTPRSLDGQLLFLFHMISKMDRDRGSRIGIVMNGSPLFREIPEMEENPELKKMIRGIMFKKYLDEKGNTRV